MSFPRIVLGCALISLLLSVPAVGQTINCRILEIEEGIFDNHHKKPCYRVVVGVEYQNLTRAEVKLTTKANSGGKKYSPSATRKVGSVPSVEFLVPEDWIGTPGTGEEIIFSAEAIGYYVTTEYRQVPVVEYQPVITPGHGSGHNQSYINIFE